MSQEEIIKILEKKLKVLITELENEKAKYDLNELLWEKAVTKGEIFSTLGTSLIGISRALSKLCLQHDIVVLKNDLDKRERRYMIKDENIISMVNDGSNQCSHTDGNK